jgi:hypothetical protein
MRASRSPISCSLALATLAVLPLTAAVGQTASDGRLAVHGYLTQGYAVSHGAQFYGITDQGSTDFRYAALQFRYDKGQDGFLLQLNGRRLGQSPITSFESSVNVNWMFYERRMKNGTQLRVGRIPVPRGIYNEQRSIGVLLPFYRVPVIFYDEAAYFSETIDGAVISRSFRAAKPWSLDAHLYGGGWSLLSYDQSGSTYAIGRVRAENAVGTQVWLNTPMDGLRFGASAQKYLWQSLDDSGVLTAKQRVYELQGSIDGNFSRVMLRAESELLHFETDHYYGNYAMAGYKLTRQLALNVMGEYAYERDWTAGIYPRAFDWHKTVGVSANYSFSPSLVLKIENHWDRGIQVEQAATPLDPPRFRYFIASLSAAF